MNNKWPKTLPTLTSEQQAINHDFAKYWHEVLASQTRYSLIEKFNHHYPIKHAPRHFLKTLEIGAGLGEHLNYEKLSAQQELNYVALELRENMAEKIRTRFSNIKTIVGDCQETIPYQIIILIA